MRLKGTVYNVLDITPNIEQRTRVEYTFVMPPREKKLDNFSKTLSLLY